MDKEFIEKLAKFYKTQAAGGNLYGKGGSIMPRRFSDLEKEIEDLRQRIQDLETKFAIHRIKEIDEELEKNQRRVDCG